MQKMENLPKIDVTKAEAKMHGRKSILHMLVNDIPLDYNTFHFTYYTS